MKKRTLLTMALLLPSVMAMSAAYQLNLQGLRQLAMGGGGAAWPWDASTIFYNPGGLSMLEGMQVYGSFGLIIPHVKYVQTPTGGTEADAVSQTFPTFNFYLGGPLKKHGRFGVGVGVYTPYGSGLKWDDNWSGRYVTQEIMLESIFIQPTISYRISDMVSIGAGFVYAFGNVHLRQAIPIQNVSGMDGQAELKGKGNGTGYNVGINVKANDRLHFGISYRSRVDFKLHDGTATFVVPTSVASEFPNTTVDGSLPLPEVLSIGVGYKPLEHLTLQLDFNLTGWKAFDILHFDYGQNTSSLLDTYAPRMYKNRLATRLGANYQASKSFAIMLGGAYDPTPVQDNYVSPDLPDANRIVLTCGFSLHPSRHLNILAAVEYVTSDKRNGMYLDANFSGRYQTKGVTPCIGITYDL